MLVLLRIHSGGGMLNSKQLFSQLEKMRVFAANNHKESLQLLEELKNKFPTQKDFLDRIVSTKPLTKEDINILEGNLKKVPNVDISLCPLDVYAKILPYAKLMHAVEKNGIPEEHAYKLTVIFQDEKKALNYLEDFIHAHPKVEHVMHDANLFALPTGKWNVTTWQKLCSKFLKDEIFRTKILPSADILESFIKDKAEVINKDKSLKKGELIAAIKTKTDDIEKTNAKFKELKKKHGNLNEAEKKEYNELITIITQKQVELTELGIPFNEQLTLTALSAFKKVKDLYAFPALKYFLNNSLTENDYAKFVKLNRNDAGEFIPDIKIDGKELGYPGYYLMKVDVKDEMQAARAACFGKLTNCCQSLSGEAGESCTIHGLTSPNGGFYVLCQGDINNPQISDKLYGQCWAWLSKNKAIVFDSIESASKYETTNEMVIKFYQSLGRKLVLEGYTDKVHCGDSSGISDKVGLMPLLPLRERFIDYKGYCDSNSQLVIYDINNPYYWYGIDEDLPAETIQLIEIFLQDPRKLVEIPGLMPLLNWDIFNKRCLSQKMLKLALEKYPHRYGEVSDHILSMHRFIDGELTSSAMMELIKNNQLYINTINQEQITPLLKIFNHKLSLTPAERNSLALELINNGANIHAKDKKNNTALIYAAKYGLKETVKALIEKGAVVNAYDREGRTALMLTASPEIAEMLIQHGADIEDEDIYGNTVLMQVIAKKNSEMYKTLINHVIEYDHKNEKGETALMVATRVGDMATIKDLLAKGADINVKNKNNDSLLRSAIHAGLTDFAKELIEKNIGINDSGIVWFALDRNQKEIALALINKNSDVNANDRYPPLIETLSSWDPNREELLLALISHGADVNPEFTYQYMQDTALSMAIRDNLNTVVSALIKAGADVNKAARDVLPLRDALDVRHKIDEKVVLEILEKANDINCKNDSGTTPLMNACFKGYNEVVFALLKRNCNINEQNCSGFNALMVAIKNGNKEIVLALIKTGADLFAKHMNGESAWSMMEQNEEFKALLKTLHQAENKENVNINPLIFSQSKTLSSSIPAKQALIETNQQQLKL